MIYRITRAVYVFVRCLLGATFLFAVFYGPFFGGFTCLVDWNDPVLGHRQAQITAWPWQDRDAIIRRVLPDPSDVDDIVICWDAASIAGGCLFGMAPIVIGLAALFHKEKPSCAHELPQPS